MAIKRSSRERQLCQNATFPCCYQEDVSEGVRGGQEDGFARVNAVLMCGRRITVCDFSYVRWQRAGLIGQRHIDCVCEIYGRNTFIIFY
jgi:hypothetical protein